MYNIIDKTGTRVGTFAGSTALEALEAMATAAGWNSYQDRASIEGGHFARWTELPEEFAAFGKGLFVAPAVGPEQPEGWPKTNEQIESDATTAQAAVTAARETLSDINAVIKALSALEDAMQYPGLGDAERAALNPLVGPMAGAAIVLKAFAGAMPEEIDRLDDVASEAYALLVAAET